MKFINDLKKGYPIVLESSIILAILLVLLAFKFPAGEPQPITFPENDFDTVKTVDTPITDPDNTPPNPPKPSVFIEVPNHKIVDDPVGELNIDWENGDQLSLPEDPRKFDDEEIFEVVEHYPKMKGGMASLYEKIKYPRRARLAGIEGTVKVQFVVDKKGQVTNAKVINGIGWGCDKEALEAVQKLQFTPGYQRGMAVNVEMSLPVIFDLR